jgi:signal transduction histidine kinase
VATSGLLVQENPGVATEWIHWRRQADGRWSALGLDGAAVHRRLLGSLTPAGVTPPPGTMLLLNDFGAYLHAWGQVAFRPGMEPELSLVCASPLKRWRVGYLAAPGEFPSAALFPILLGITSGSLVVPALAWLYSRESSREIRVARQRVSFVNQVSHELKTPLTNIRLYAEMARARAEERGDAAAVRQLTVVESETARLSRLIQNVLNFARKQRDRLTVSPKPCQLSPVIARLVDHWQPVLEKRGLTLEVTSSTALEVMADADAVEQILGNLLSNAEKYALEGRWVGLSVAETPDLAAVEVSVTDRGPGIPSGKMETIFEPFERLRSDLREGVSGTGIGLTISRELAQLMGGQLRVDGQHRSGSRFVLTLPKVALPSPTTPAAALPATPQLFPSLAKTS